MKLSRRGLIASLTYFGVFVLSGLYAIYLLVFNTANSEFSGMVALLVTLPWSVIFSPVLSSFGYIDWYTQFASSPAVYGIFAVLGLLPGAIINAIVLYFLFRSNLKSRSD
ncbi:MAG: hypothetical protein KGZ30_00435 [Anaplasmataceae bacterium]|nr:hypothetical protein [Anaplasmataceae bacterium]